MTGISTENLLAVFQGKGGNRPVAMLSFALNYYLFQYKVFGFHLVNVTIHAVNSILVFVLLRLTLRRLSDKQGNPDIPAFLAALLWLAHPVQTQSVSYIVQRMNSLMALFFLLSLIFYVLGRTRPQKIIYFTVSTLAGILSFLSKQNAATLPVVLLLYEWFFFQNLDYTFFRKHWKAIVLACAAIPLLLIASLLYLTPFSNLDIKLLSNRATVPFLMTVPRVIVHYVSLLLYPHPSRLNLDYDFPYSQSLLDPLSTVFSLLFLIALLLIAFLSARRYRLLSFAILWFLGTLSVESLLVTFDIIFEHRLYLPSVFVFAGLSFYCFKIVNRPVPIVVLMVMVAVIFSVWTVQRNQVWQSSISLWQDTISKSPKKARPNNNLGFAYLVSGQEEKAFPYLKKAIQIDPEYIKAYNNLAIYYERQNQLEKARNHYRKALLINPRYMDAKINLVNLLIRTGDSQSAKRLLDRILGQDPDNPIALNSMGVLQQNQGKLSQALSSFKKALEGNPSYLDALINLGNLYLILGNPDKSKHFLNRALQLSPQNTVVHYHLANYYHQQGEFDSALAYYQTVIRSDPENADAHNNIGVAWEKFENWHKAVYHYAMAIHLQPEHHSAKTNLIGLLKQRNIQDMDRETALELTGLSPKLTELLQEIQPHPIPE